MKGLFGCAALVAFALLCSACSKSDPNAAPADTRVLVAFLLDADVDGLTQAAAKSATIQGAAASEFLTLEEVASKYGAHDSVVKKTRSDLKSLGIEVHLDPTGAVLWGETSVKDAEAGLGVNLSIEAQADGTSVVVPDKAPEVPEGLDGVKRVVGLMGTIGSDGKNLPTGTAPKTSGSTPACPPDPISATELQQLYGLEWAAPAGLTGAGVSIALLEQQSVDEGSFAAYNACVSEKITPKITTHSVPLAPKAKSGSEVALDTIVLGLLAPAADLEVTLFDPNASVVFSLLQVISNGSGAEASAGGTTEVLVTTSGYCESDVSPADAETAEWLLAAMAAAGTTSITSSGDTGSSSCHPDNDPAVQYPASSAWVISGGGVEFTGTPVAPTDLKAWNDTPEEDQGGGGGESALIAKPSWQQGVMPDSKMRVVPDFAAYAQPSGLGAVPWCGDSGCEWQDLGGTSLSGTALGAIVALGGEDRATIDGKPARFGHVAAEVYDQPDEISRLFTDVTEGNNEVFTDKCCSTAVGFDSVTGWGLLNAEEFANRNG